MNTRLLLVDDSPAMRRGLRSLLACRADWEVVGEAANGAQAVELAFELRPDVIIMDLRMPIMDGLAATRILKRHSPQTRVIILSATEVHDFVEEAFTVGADACFSKFDPTADLLRAISMSD